MSGKKSSKSGVSTQAQSEIGDKKKKGKHNHKMNCFEEEKKKQDKKNKKKKKKGDYESELSGEGEKETVEFECLSGCCKNKSGNGNGFTHRPQIFECVSHGLVTG